MNKKVYITRRARFNAAHKLWNPLWDEQKNQEIFGKCSNHNWHGHNYELHVTVKGTPHVDTGYCMDMKELSDIIKEFVEEPLDHKNLNLDVPWMHGKLASTENLVIEIWNQPLRKSLVSESSEPQTCRSGLFLRRKLIAN